MSGEVYEHRSVLAQLLDSPAASQEDLVLLLGSEQLDELRQGDRAPTLDEAALLAVHFGTSVMTLTGETNSAGLSFRSAIREVSEAEPEVRRASRLLEAERLTAAWGLRNERRSIKSFSLARGNHIVATAQLTAARLRAYLNIGPLEPIDDLVGLVESIGFPVEHRSMAAGLHGLSVRETRGRMPSEWMVFVNCDDWWGRQRFTLAHELCHGLYDDSGHLFVEKSVVPDAPTERRAEAFARHFLLPEQALISVIKRNDTVRDIYAAARLIADVTLTYGLSRQASIGSLRHVVSKQYLEYWKESSVPKLMSAANRLDEWNAQVEVQHESSPSPMLSEQVLRAFSERLVGIETVATVIADGDVEVARSTLRESGWSDDLLI